MCDKVILLVEDKLVLDAIKQFVMYENINCINKNFATITTKTLGMIIDDNFKKGEISKFIIIYDAFDQNQQRRISENINKLKEQPSNIKFKLIKNKNNFEDEWNKTFSTKYSKDEINKILKNTPDEIIIFCQKNKTRTRNSEELNICEVHYYELNKYIGLDEK